MAIVLHLLSLDSSVNIHAPIQFFFQNLRYFWFFSKDEPICHFQDGHPGSHGGEEVAIFHCDIAATDNEETIRSLLQLQHCFVGEIAQTIQTFYRRYKWARARRDENLRSLYLVAVDLDGVITNKISFPFVEV